VSCTPAIHALALTPRVYVTGVQAIEVEFRDRKLGACCADERAAQKRWGASHRKVLIRVALLRSADTLADLANAPGRLHPLEGNRKGQFALEVSKTHRLLFEPANAPLPELSDGALDRSRVTKVRVLEVVDYHGD
jgi:plasmid maintenance system killer protein